MSEENYFFKNYYLQKIYLVGYGKYCCVPECKSATKDSLKQNTDILLFQIPNRELDKTNWIKALQNHRRKGAKDSFDPRKKMAYCL